MRAYAPDKNEENLDKPEAELEKMENWKFLPDWSHSGGTIENAMNI